MLILVLVTVNVAMNGGLFIQAQEAKAETDRTKEKEQLISAAVGALDDDNAYFDIQNMKLPEGAKWISGKNGTEIAADTEPNQEGNWVKTLKGNEFYIDNKGNILDDEPVEEVPFAQTDDNFIITVNIPASDKRIVLPIFSSANLNCTINWGDESLSENVTSVTIPYIVADHTYSEEGEYDIIISGTCEEFDSIGFPEKYENDNNNLYGKTNVNYITGIKQWGNVGLKIARFGYTLIGEIPVPKENTFSQTIEMSFEGCSGIDEIPANLLKGCSNIESLNGLFDSTSIRAIPKGLLDDCINVTDVAALFSDTRIVSIPEGLFDKCTKINVMFEVFANCTLLTGEAPRLWEDFPDAELTSTFYGCTRLSNYDEIPDGAPYYMLSRPK